MFRKRKDKRATPAMQKEFLPLYSEMIRIYESLKRSLKQYIRSQMERLGEKMSHHLLVGLQQNVLPMEQGTFFVRTIRVKEVPTEKRAAYERVCQLLRDDINDDYELNDFMAQIRTDADANEIFYNVTKLARRFPKIYHNEGVRSEAFVKDLCSLRENTAIPIRTASLYRRLSRHFNEKIEEGK